MKTVNIMSWYSPADVMDRAGAMFARSRRNVASRKYKALALYLHEVDARFSWHPRRDRQGLFLRRLQPTLHH